ncbi:MAG TPA: hypothetical protein PL110_03250 [Candidatus Eremiobacteraeota bacterium]|mgnify:CR=1 FL=1|nr:hypothetical protein [Candidatus Eremiobacteraeota bacterium]
MEKINLMKSLEDNETDITDSITSYDQDGRKSIIELYKVQLELKNKYGWEMEEIFTEEILLENKQVLLLSANCLKTLSKGPALWVISGIHGEEPAGPNAITENIEIFAKLDKKGIPVVLLPLCNPLGYYKNWRYPNTPEYSETIPGHSVGDSEHLLPDKSEQARSKVPSSTESDAFTKKVLELSNEYPPVIVLDFHEDNLLEKGYIYSQGPLGIEDPAATKIVDLFLENNFPIHLSGKTRFNEDIKGGIISGVQDGSIDELLSAKKIILNGTLIEGPSAKSVIVIETSSMNTVLSERIKVHSKIMSIIEDLWDLYR